MNLSQTIDEIDCSRFASVHVATRASASESANVADITEARPILEALCETGEFCRIGDCNPGAEGADPVTGCVVVPRDCDDKIFCTDDSCIETTEEVPGHCLNDPSDENCPDGECTAGVCDPSDEGADADGCISVPVFSEEGEARAYGLQVQTAIPMVNLGPLPDTDEAPEGDKVLVQVGDPAAAHVAVLNVTEEEPPGGSPSATATAENTTILKPTVGDALVAAAIVRTEANCNATCTEPDGVEIEGTGTTEIVNLKINGTPVACPGPTEGVCKPAPNTPILTQDLKLVILNEQLCNGVEINTNNTPCNGRLEVNAIHVMLPEGIADVIVSHAECEAEASFEE